VGLTKMVQRHLTAHLLQQLGLLVLTCHGAGVKFDSGVLTCNSLNMRISGQSNLPTSGLGHYAL